MYSQSFATSSASKLIESDNFMDNLSYLLILVPAALADSINPCAFAVMIILLSSILKQHKSRKKVLIAGAMFVLAIFLSYVAMWLALYQTLADNFDPTYIKYAVWVIGILIWLANLKDYFWYGKYFRMEVPTAWRPKMFKLLRGVTSPAGAFVIWLLISLFLLPCTSGPYLVVTSHFTSNQIGFDLALTYILIYNLVFILPMLFIMYMIAFGVKSVEEINELKELNVEKMHLVTWIIMFLLGIYVLLDASGVITKLMFIF
jgi:cytochrome c biogenesis protein CcdA